MPTDSPSVAICLPVYERPEQAMIRCLRQLVVPRGAHVFDVEGMLIEDARNAITEEALAVHGITHLMWIDDDMTFPPHGLNRLLAHDKPIVGGLCHSRHLPYHPILGRKLPEWCQRKSPFGFVYHYPPDDLFEVDATGGAFLLVKREVFDAITEKYGEEWWTKEGGLSEDFSFCTRAKACGYPIHVDTGLKIGHIGKLVINEDTAKKLRPFRWEEWIPDSDPRTGAPIASIVIPTYNQDPKLLAAAIYSAAKQTVPVEVVVVDDGSTTPVSTTGWPANVRVIRQDNKGVSGALNTGIRAITTDWFCWLSSDDMISPRKIELQLSVLQQSRSKASFHSYQTVDADEAGWSRFATVIEWKTIKEQMSWLAQACVINGSTVMLHKSVVDDVGLFDESMRYGQDWEYWCRVGEKYFWYPITEILGTRREGRNLTAAIEKDSAKQLARDTEDEQIKSKFAHWLSIG